jgi:hypothetical protein
MLGGENSALLEVANEYQAPDQGIDGFCVPLFAIELVAQLT